MTNNNRVNRFEATKYMSNKGVMLSKKAEAGMGTLLLFIAFILVASIAAVVLIDTSGSLQSKALNTGTKTQTAVSSGISVLSIYGENATPALRVDNIHATVRLVAGGTALVINQSSLEMSSGATSYYYIFNQTGNCSNAWLASAASARGQFAVTAKGGYNLPGIMQEGDLLDICARVPNGLNESRRLMWEFAPKAGAFTRINTQIPTVITSERSFLFP